MKRTAVILLLAGIALPVWAANSDIRISSIGYVTTRAKYASVINAGGASAFQVRRAADYSVAFAGMLAPVVADETGDQVRKADFSALAEQTPETLRPARDPREDGAAPMVKFGVAAALTVSAMVVLWVSAPEVPVMVTVAAPVVAVAGRGESER